MKIEISKVTIGRRHRKDMGDLQGLAASIKELGLLQPIGVTEKNELVFGERRLRAIRDVLKQDKIEAKVVDVSSIIRGEHAENEIRKDFTLTERAAIAEAIEREIGSRRGQRTDIKPPAATPQVPRPATRSTSGQLSGSPVTATASSQPTVAMPATQPAKSPSQLRDNCPQVATPSISQAQEIKPGQKTREFAAVAAGFGNHKTLERVKQVAKQGSPELIKAMNDGEIAVSTAAKLAALPKEKQQAAVAGGKEAVKAVINPAKSEPRYPLSDKFHHWLECIIGNILGVKHDFGSLTKMFDDPKWDNRKNAEFTDELERYHKCIGDWIKEMKEYAENTSQNVQGSAR